MPWVSDGAARRGLGGLEDREAPRVRLARRAVPATPRGFVRAVGRFLCFVRQASTEACPLHGVGDDRPRAPSGPVNVVGRPVDGRAVARGVFLHLLSPACCVTVAQLFSPTRCPLISWSGTGSRTGSRVSTCSLVPWPAFPPEGSADCLASGRCPLPGVAQQRIQRLCPSRFAQQQGEPEDDDARLRRPACAGCRPRSRNGRRMAKRVPPDGGGPSSGSDDGSRHGLRRQPRGAQAGRDPPGGRRQHMGWLGKSRATCPPTFRGSQPPPARSAVRHDRRL